MLNFDEIKELVELVAEKRLEGLEIERAGFRLAIEGHSASPASPGRSAEASPAATEKPAQAVEVPQPPEETAGESGDVPQGAHIVTSPIVGTFYSAPSPDADPYVQPGDRVRKGQVVCIVEAMKLMNEIESDVDGVVVEVYPKNAQPVEFGERLFAIQSA